MLRMLVERSSLMEGSVLMVAKYLATVRVPPGRVLDFLVEVGAAAIPGITASATILVPIPVARTRRGLSGWATH